MKIMKWLLIIIVVAVVSSAGVLTTRADDTKAVNPKPYPLHTCLVCGMKLSDMGKPYLFV